MKFFCVCRFGRDRAEKYRSGRSWDHAAWSGGTDFSAVAV